MADFKKQFPESKPFKCCSAWHLHRSGNLLALYDFIGALTDGGERTFYSSIKKAAIFFYGRDDKSTYETVRQLFRTLKRQGWLKKSIQDGQPQWTYVSHDEWAAANQGKCQRRELFPWKGQPSPFMTELWKASNEKLRIESSTAKRILQITSEETFLEAFKKEIAAAEARRIPGGDWSGTSPKACFDRVFGDFLNRAGRLC